MNTRSLNSFVTDSAAASSSWGSGSRVTNGALNVLPNGTLLTPLYELFGQKKWARGLVTTAEITHATPAGFAVATKSRENAQVIAAQYLDRKIEVLLGGGSPFFSRRRRKDRRDLRGDFATADTRWCGTSRDLNKRASTRHCWERSLTHIFPIPSTSWPVTSSGPRFPPWPRMTKAALARLERHDHFILQVEGARVDHAAHNSDAAAAIHDQMALDEAIDICLEFQKAHPDTLIVMTTDHGNSNLGLNGNGWRLPP
jgi:alkaline phosphatase